MLGLHVKLHAAEGTAGGEGTEECPVNGSLLTCAGTLARVRDALAREAYEPGGRDKSLAHAPERAAAARLEELYPGLGRMFLAAHEFHRRAAAWAVTGGSPAFPVPPAAGVLFCGAGLPVPGEPLHARAASAAPAARFAYIDADDQVADVNEGALAGERVAVGTAWPGDPRAVLGTPACAALLDAGPASVHLVMMASRWPAGLAAAAVAGYARLLPPGSTVALSLVVPDPGEAGRRMAQDGALAGSPGYAHSQQDVAAWFTGAGMRLHPSGVQPARAFGRDWAAAYRLVPRLPGRVMAAAGLVP